MSFTPTGAAGDVVRSALPAGVEFAFWGRHSTHPGRTIIAFRVTEAGDYSWGDEGDTDLEPGFDYHLTTGDANLAAMNVGEYVILGLSQTLTEAQYLSAAAFWGFDPLAVIPGSGWHPHITPDAMDIPYDHTTSALTATDVQAALDELTARIVALETP